MTTETGTVTWFNEGKGSGFKTLTENQRVQFEVRLGQKGPPASNIRTL